MSDIKRRYVVAEVTKKWPQYGVVDLDTLAQKFEEAIEYYAFRGYRLESWKMSGSESSDGGSGSETIVAVFELERP